MREIQSGSRFVYDKNIPTWITELVSCNILRVEAGTNGYCGGDTGHGCRFYIRIEDVSSSDIEVVPILKSSTSNGGIVLTGGGDCELETLIDALDFIVEALKDCIEKEGMV